MIKDNDHSEDYVRIFLKNKPDSEDYYECGIYYSPSGELLDC